MTTRASARQRFEFVRRLLRERLTNKGRGNQPRSRIIRPHSNFLISPTPSIFYASASLQGCRRTTERSTATAALRALEARVAGAPEFRPGHSFFHFPAGLGLA